MIDYKGLLLILCLFCLIRYKSKLKRMENEDEMSRDSNFNEFDDSFN